MPRQTVESRVEKGIRWLDASGAPGWRTRSEAPPIDCAEGWANPLGVAFAPLELGDLVGDHPSAILTEQEARRLGFVVEPGGSWDRLTEVWRAALALA